MYYATEDMLFGVFRRGGETARTIVFNSLDIPENLTKGRVFIEIPDDWLIWVKDGRLTVGKEDGFSLFSPKGFHINIEKIKLIWLGGRGTRTEAQWEEFYNNTMKEYERIAKKTEKYIKLLQSKIDDAHDALELLKSSTLKWSLINYVK